jgi:hypothetical protein
VALASRSSLKTVLSLAGIKNERSCSTSRWSDSVKTARVPTLTKRFNRSALLYDSFAFPVRPNFSRVSHKPLMNFDTLPLSILKDLAVATTPCEQVTCSPHSLGSFL